MILKIYGERNTGSNYLMQLLEKNVNVVSRCGSAFEIEAAGVPQKKWPYLDELGWKHRLVDVNFLQHYQLNRDNILFVCLIKNPYSWLLSMHRCAYAPIQLRTRVVKKRADDHYQRFLWHEIISRSLGFCNKHIARALSRYPAWCWYENLSFSDFIRTQWFSEFQEGCDEGFENAVALWNEKNNAYLQLEKNYNVLCLTYEQLLESPKIVLTKIIDSLGCPYKKFTNIEVAAKKKDKRKNYDYYRDYYLNERWKRELLPKDIDWISARLDPTIMRAFGYSFLEEK